jgi:hypothetical protein
MLLVCCSCTKKEKLLIGGVGWQQIAIVDKASGEVEWSHPLEADEECNDVELTPRGEILYAGKKDAKLITRKHETVWSYEVGASEAVYTAACIESGHYLLAIAGFPARLVELDKTGEVIREVTFHAASRELERQFRQILKTPQNTYLVPLIDKHKISEIGEDGRTVRTVYCGGNPVAIKVTQEGNWLISGGESRFIAEINPDTKEVLRNVVSGDLNWSAFLYVGELIRYENGNTLVANWNGGGEDKSQPQILEIDGNNQVVWRLPYHPDIAHVSSVYSFFE